MDGTKALYYGAIALAILIGVGVVLSVISAIVGLVGAVISGVVSLAVLAGVVYAAYAVGSWVFGDNDPSVDTGSLGSSRPSSASTDAPESRHDRLRRQYVEGQISEAEFERRIGEELETEEFDDVDIDRELDDINRELERER